MSILSNGITIVGAKHTVLVEKFSIEREGRPTLYFVSWLAADESLETRECQDSDHAYRTAQYIAQHGAEEMIS